MIALTEPLSQREEEELALFRFEPKLGYAKAMRHVYERWTWEETERYLRDREERRLSRTEVHEEQRAEKILGQLRDHLCTVEQALRYLDKLWPDPEPGLSFVESAERSTLGEDD